MNLIQWFFPQTLVSILFFFFLNSVFIQRILYNPLSYTLTVKLTVEGTVGHSFSGHLSNLWNQAGLNTEIILLSIYPSLS